MNILVLGARVIGSEMARELVRTFLSAEFTGEERHQRRLEKINNLERRIDWEGKKQKANVKRQK